ncbi:hypothetical protein LGQ02_05730 [Bacillus shivajii]|uniref:hypothetical protein n=1 Tax=Bacillus shivajii TaxID=1983719 RepID=UPI001CFB4F8D|nr:hypothetical protein [Bacillus shivajii]UCZ54262.1 hypothetical protein LGQ02_05730 [Bacillus shivajii]
MQHPVGLVMVLTGRGVLLEKVRIHPLIILTLIMSSISMGIYAYQNYTNQEMGYGILFTLLFIFLIGLVIFGLMRNRKIDNKKIK